VAIIVPVVYIHNISVVDLIRATGFRRRGRPCTLDAVAATTTSDPAQTAWRRPEQLYVGGPVCVAHKTPEAIKILL